MPSVIPEQLDGPRTHALVIGVSSYRHLDDGPEPTGKGALLNMGQLSAAARSASEFAAWLDSTYEHPVAPLGSLRVLLAPSPGEQIHPSILDRLDLDAALATRDHVLADLIAFKKACDTNPENVAVVYVAGHGVQLSKTGSIVLLHDCGSDGHLNLLDGAIDMASVHAGFDHPGTAQSQFWFVDACRQTPAVARRFESLEGGIVLEEPVGVANSTPMFLAASSREKAFARVNGITLFNEALMAALGGGIAQMPALPLSDKWHVSVLGLVARLRGLVQGLAEAEGATQTVHPAGTPIDAVFHEYTAGPPDVDLTVELTPPVDGSVGALRHGEQGVLLDDVREWPLHRQVPAGLYQCTVASAAGGEIGQALFQALPPHERVAVKVEP